MTRLTRLEAMKANSHAIVLLQSGAAAALKEWDDPATVFTQGHSFEAMRTMRRAIEHLEARR